MTHKLHKPKRENGVQKPGKLTGFITNLLVVMSVLMVLLMVLGLLTKDLQFALISGGVSLFMFAIVVLLKHSYDTSYEESSEYLIIRNGKKQVKIFYENIIDWRPTFNEISILDKTKEDEKFVRINIVFFKPEILIRSLADMTFEGKFQTSDKKYFEDPKRERQLVAYLVNNNYAYLIEDYIDQIEKRSIL